MTKLDRTKMNQSDYYRKLQEERVNASVTLKGNRVKNDEKALYYSRGNEPYLNQLLKASGDSKNPLQMGRDKLYKDRLNMYLDLQQKHKSFNDAHYKDLQNETYLGAIKTSSNNLENIVLKIAETSPINAAQNRQKLIENLKMIRLTPAQAQELADSMNDVEVYVLYTFWSEFVTDIVSNLTKNAPTLTILKRFIVKFIDDKISEMDDSTRSSLLSTLSSMTGSSNSIFSGLTASLYDSSSSSESSSGSRLGAILPFGSDSESGASIPKGRIAPEERRNMPYDEEYYFSSSSSGDNRSASEKSRETLLPTPAVVRKRPLLIENDVSQYRPFYGTSTDESTAGTSTVIQKGTQLLKDYNDLDEQLQQEVQSEFQKPNNDDERRLEIARMVDSYNSADKKRIKNQEYSQRLMEVRYRYVENRTPMAVLKGIIANYNLEQSDYEALKYIDPNFTVPKKDHTSLKFPGLFRVIAYCEIFIGNKATPSKQSPSKSPSKILKDSSEEEETILPKKPTRTVRQVTLDDPVESGAESVKSSSSLKRLSDSESVSSNKSKKKVSGSGLRKKYVIGRGLSLKYDVDLKKLDQNTLCVRYKNNSHGYKVKPIRISDNCKKVILQLAMNEYLHEDLFDTLVPKEKRLVEHYVQQMKIPIKLSKENLNDLTERFEVLKGQIQSGNNNPKLKEMLMDITCELYYFGYINKKLYDSIVEIYG